MRSQQTCSKTGLFAPLVQLLPPADNISSNNPEIQVYVLQQENHRVFEQNENTLSFRQSQQSLLRLKLNQSLKKSSYQAVSSCFIEQYKHLRKPAGEMIHSCFLRSMRGPTGSPAPCTVTCSLHCSQVKLQDNDPV